MSTAAQLRIVSVAPGPKRRTFLLQLSRPLTNGEAAELNVRTENPDFSGLGESTLSVASEDRSILVTGEMSADKLEAQMPDFEKFLTLIETQGRELDEFEEKRLNRLGQKRRNKRGRQSRSMTRSPSPGSTRGCRTGNDDLRHHRLMRVLDRLGEGQGILLVL